jgi:predicted MPP superfamily phosphohydrolase
LDRPAADLKVWRRISGYDEFGSRRREGCLRINSAEVKTSGPAAGKTLVFFSDLHWTFPPPPFNELRNAINRINPDFLVFGGDLASEACHIEESLLFMSSLKAKNRLAVFGNWDRRRRRWFPCGVWRDLYREAGYTLLVNESLKLEGVDFYGLDDYKTGVPRFSPAPGAREIIMISHNPDSAAELLSPENARRVRLVLCGHTHGGQIRAPFFGALKTSSVFWKKFEYGRFARRDTDTGMIVTSGIGETGRRLRLFCAPEIVSVSLTAM